MELSIRNVGIVGSGVMGRGIAQWVAQGGCTVRLFDSNDDAAVSAKEFAVKMLRRLVEKGQLSSDDADAMSDGIEVAKTLAELADCDLVIEAIVEKLEPKRALFQALEDVVQPSTILATNTSSLSVAAITNGRRYPDRFAGLHFFNPVPLIPLVEVVSAPQSAPEMIEELIAWVRRLRHRPIRAKDLPGFVVNHAGCAFVTEGLAILEENVCSPAILDTVMREALGFRLGPYELLDLTGLDVTVPATEAIYANFYQEPRLRPSALARSRLESGMLGRKTSSGFYSDVPFNASAAEEAAASDVACPTRVAVVAERPHRQRVINWVVRRGARITAVNNAEVIFVAPIGRDASWEASIHGLDASRVVAVDPLFGLGKHTTLCATPATQQSVLSAALCLARQSQSRASLIGDSVGLLCQRVVAMIVNLGCELAQKSIASPADIDDAVRIGLGYPHGPLAGGDVVGARVILELSRNLFETTGDPRYRPSAWLCRRAALGIPLTMTGYD